MEKPVAVFDIDGTLYRSNLLVELVEALIIQGTFERKVRDQFTQSYQDWRMHRNRLTYVQYIDSLVLTYLENIKGIPVYAVQTAVDLVMKKAPEQLYVFGRSVLNEVKDSHFKVAISGSPIDIVEPFTRSLGFDYFHSSTYEKRDGFYTGNAVAGHKDKDETLLKIVEEYGLTFVGSIAMGDTDADIPMLDLVSKNGGRSIAFNPNKELLMHGLENGWDVISEHKDTILHLSGGRFEVLGDFGHFYSA